MSSEAEQGDDVIGVTARRAAKILNLSLKQLDGWERNGLVRPQMHRQHGGVHVRTYGLGELVELSVVKQLQDRGISISRIRRVVDALHKQAPHPLRQLHWGVEGRDMYVQFDDGGWVGGRRPHQGVIIQTIDLEELRTVARRRATQRDEENVGRIEQRANTLGRKKVFAGTRTPVDAIQAYLDRGAGVAEILKAFPHLSSEDIEAARRESVGA